MFTYEPINFQVKRLGLRHQPKVKSVAVPTMSPEEYVIEQHIAAGNKARREKKQLEAAKD